jgi:large conductance mechanosensitive channel
MKTQQPQAEPQPAPLQAKREAPREFAAGFIGFLRQYNVIPLAIAVVLGNAVNDLVKQLVEGIVTPFIALILPNTAIQGYEVTIGPATFRIGMVISAILSFMVIAFVVYTFVKKVLHDETVLKRS